MLAAADQTNELCKRTVAELIAAFAAGELSPVEVAKAALDRADQINPALNAFTLADHEGALAAACASERRWRNGGVLGMFSSLEVKVLYPT